MGGDAGSEGWGGREDTDDVHADAGHNYPPDGAPLTVPSQHRSVAPDVCPLAPLAAGSSLESSLRGPEQPAAMAGGSESDGSWLEAGEHAEERHSPIEAGAVAEAEVRGLLGASGEGLVILDFPHARQGSSEMRVPLRSCCRCLRRRWHY